LKKREGENRTKGGCAPVAPSVGVKLWKEGLVNSKRTLVNFGKKERENQERNPNPWKRKL